MKNESISEDFLFYMVDVDMYREDYGVVETVKGDLFRNKSLKKATDFARKYAKEPSNFDFQYLDNKDCDCYMMTIRKYYKEETEDENGNWDDWDVIEVKRPKNN